LDKDYGRKISALGNRPDETAKWLCIGIADNGTLVGHDEKWARATEQTISQQVNKFLDPSQACIGITCHDFGGRWIIILKIENPGAVVKWQGAAYKATGTTLQQMDAAEVMELTVRLPGLSDYSAQECSGPASEDGIISFANRLFSRRPELSAALETEEERNELLARIGIKDTNVARILFGNCPYRVVYYDGPEQVSGNTTGYGLANLLSDTFLESIESWTSEQTGVPSPIYPVRAVREALANAVAHAAYFENDGEIIIEAFEDCLSISNLCVRESEYFANKWFSRSHKTINRLLMESLRLSGHVDELGLGKNVIFAESLRNGKRPPQVNVEPGHRYDRWRLYLYGGHRDETQLRLLQRCRQTYPDERKALIANALVLWRDRPVAEIRKFID
jgi:predicted HTH transcriptional regulator